MYTHMNIYTYTHMHTPCVDVCIYTYTHTAYTCTHYIATFPYINTYIIQLISLVAQMVKNLPATRET